jgi:hypothetical protein
MPHFTILPIQHPVILIRKIQKFARDSPFLEDVEQHNPLGLRKPVVERVVHDELGRGPVGDVVDGIPALVVVAVVPEGAVELGES